jgi:phage/conjugal plasmid C-4 type zinc finger TraR family protein
MTDIFDRAAELELRQREDAVARQRDEALARNQASAASLGVRDCVDCELPIPTKRRKAIPGCTRCIECEQAVEARSKLMRR